MNQVISNPYEQDPAAAAGGNPYLDLHAAPSADLDDTGPALRQAEQRRVNRKALLFLGGIVLLLMLMAVLVLRGGTRKDGGTKPTEERVSIPTLGDAPPPLPSRSEGVPAEPIGLQPEAQAAPLPPLPAQADYAAAPPAPGFDPPRTQARQTPTLLERRMGLDAGASAAPPMGPQDAYAQALSLTQAAIGGRGAAKPDDSTDGAPAGRARASSARALRRPDALLIRGTMLRCVLETRIVSDIPGYTACILTEPVYSVNGRSLLLERGSKIYGSYDHGPTGDRMAVVWDRITTPSGVDVEMASPGVDNLGGAGHPGQRDPHWPTRIASALMVSLLSDAFKYAAAENGPSTASVAQGVVVVSPYESNTARTLDRIANQAVQESMSRPPTVTLNQGTLVNVYVARDVDFSEVLGR
ncbi:TrbI/VirB10 family protein [Lysobacter xanthus]